MIKAFIKNRWGYVLLLLLFMPIAHAEEFAGLDWAVALNEIGKTEQGDSRAHFRLGYEW